MNTPTNSTALRFTLPLNSTAIVQKCCECDQSVGVQSLWTNDKGPICQRCWADQYSSQQPTETDILRDTMTKMEYNHRHECEKMSRVIRRLVRYADRIAEKHPKAVTIHRQNARVEGSLWLAEFDRQNVNEKK